VTEILLVDCHPDDWKNRVPHYLRVLNAAGRVSITVDYRSVSASFTLPGFHAAVITGSPMMLSESEPPDNLAAFVQGLSCPVLGICYGHQLLGRLSGAPVHSGERIERKERIRQLRPSPLFEGLGPEFEMLESHREYLDRAAIEGCGWELLAQSDSCPVEAMRHTVKPWFGVQFHPERSDEPGAVLVRNFVGLVGPV